MQELQKQIYEEEMRMKNLFLRQKQKEIQNSLNEWEGMKSLQQLIQEHYVAMESKNSESQQLF